MPVIPQDEQDAVTRSFEKAISQGRIALPSDSSHQSIGGFVGSVASDVNDMVNGIYADLSSEQQAWVIANKGITGDMIVDVVKRHMENL